MGDGTPCFPGKRDVCINGKCEVCKRTESFPRSDHLVISLYNSSTCRKVTRRMWILRTRSSLFYLQILRAKTIRELWQTTRRIEFMKDLETRKVNASLTNPCAALQDEKCPPYTSRDCSDQYIITAVLALFSVTFSRLTQNRKTKKCVLLRWNDFWWTITFNWCIFDRYGEMGIILLLNFSFVTRFNLESVFLLFSDSMLVVIMFSIQMQKRTNVVFVAVMEQRVRRSSQLLTRELE